MRKTSELDVGAAEFAHECRIRDLFARRMHEFRPGEILISTESSFPSSNRRADLKSVDVRNVLRLYEFKLIATPAAVGQALTYINLEQQAVGYDREVRGVLAAFRFEPDVIPTIRAMHLPIEVVTLPPHLARAGGVPLNCAPPTRLPDFSKFPNNN